MTETDKDSPLERAPSSEPTPLEALIRRASAANIETETRTFEDLEPGHPRSYAFLKLPNGRRTRRIVAYPRTIPNLLAIDFENFVVLGDYLALVDKRSGDIEAKVSSGPASRVAQRLLDRVPGIEVLSSGEPETDDDAFAEETPEALRKKPISDWRLAVSSGNINIEISPSSPGFDAIFGQGATIKIKGVANSSHDEALEALHRYGSAMLFDLDLVYGVIFQLTKLRKASRPRRHAHHDHPPKFPQNQYADQALELYQYGRSAAGLPLLEYLAYYQSLEFFFPFYAREQTVNSVRTHILHPRFNAHDDAALNRVINLAAAAGRGGMAEREQLRATLRACATDADLRNFIESIPEYEDHFCSKSQAIKGVGSIQLNGNHVDLRDQVADRIYAIRCRIVHAKQDGGGSSGEVLLPSSGETGSLQADIELLRLVSQQALVARAARS